MKRQEELLMTDLCARIPYGVKVEVKDFPRNGQYELVGFNLYDENMPIVTCKTSTGIINIPLRYVKPYLLPLSNLTDEQYKEYCELEHSGDMEHLSVPLLVWLNKNHFDYRDLIPIGLANNATNLNIY